MSSKMAIFNPQEKVLNRRLCLFSHSNVTDIFDAIEMQLVYSKGIPSSVLSQNKISLDRTEEVIFPRFIVVSTFSPKT